MITSYEISRQANQTAYILLVTCNNDNNYENWKGDRWTTLSTWHIDIWHVKYPKYRRGRSKGGTYVPRHRVLRPSLRRCDRTLLVYAEARHRTYVALDVSREKKRKWGGSWLGRRRTASSLARKELPSLPLAPGRSLMMQLNSNRRIDSAGIMILSWSETERGEARTIISPQARSSRQNHRHSMAALPSERFVAAHRIATPCISCLNPRTTSSPSRASPGESRDCRSARKNDTSSDVVVISLATT